MKKAPAEERGLNFTPTSSVRHIGLVISKAPVSQLVNADDT